MKAAAADTGMINRGKNTFDTTAPAATTLREEAPSALEKNVHGTSAARTKIGYGSPSEGSPASRPKNSPKTPISMMGWINAQPAPKNVCLYRSFTSRQTRKYVSSRCDQRSR